MSLGRPPKDQSREASDTSCGRGTGEDKTRSSATCTEGRGCKGSFFSRNIVSSKFSKFIDFCQQQMIHTPARASTRHPAKHRSKGLTCGLATAEHRLHCYVDHNNSGCCSGYEPARGEAPGHFNNLSNLYATVSFREMSRATRGHSATCELLVGILQWKVSEFRFGGLISGSYKLSARKLNQITSLRSIFGTISRDTWKNLK